MSFIVSLKFRDICQNANNWCREKFPTRRYIGRDRRTVNLVVSYHFITSQARLQQVAGLTPSELDDLQAPTVSEVSTPQWSPRATDDEVNK